MKKFCILASLALVSFQLVGQGKISDITLSSKYSTENKELHDILQFEGIEYLKLSFSGKDLVGKSYTLSVKEIWDGNITKDTVLFSSTSIPVASIQKIADSTFHFTVIGKFTTENTLKMSFKFARFSINKEFEAISSKDYSLRTTTLPDDQAIEIGKRFYILTYLLPYENEGAKFYCAVEDSGMKIEDWGKKFGIKHYLIFEMQFN